MNEGPAVGSLAPGMITHVCWLLHEVVQKVGGAGVGRGVKDMGNWLVAMHSFT